MSEHMQLENGARNEAEASVHPRRPSTAVAEPKTNTNAVSVRVNTMEGSKYSAIRKIGRMSDSVRGYSGVADPVRAGGSQKIGDTDPYDAIRGGKTQSMRFIPSHHAYEPSEHHGKSTLQSRIGSAATDSRGLGLLPAPEIGRPDLVQSKISPSLKIQLRQHVPMYNHREMGEIVYKETPSRIVNPGKASMMYRGMVKAPKVVPQFPHNTLLQNRLRLMSRGSMRGERRELLAEAAIEGHTKPKSASFIGRPLSGNASIIGKDYVHDKLVHQSLKDCFNSKPFVGPRNLQQRGSWSQVASQNPSIGQDPAQIGSNSAKVAQLSSMVSHADPALEYYAKRPHFTVWDNVRQSEWLASSSKQRPKKILFEHDSNFLTLARVDDHR